MQNTDEKKARQERLEKLQAAREKSTEPATLGDKKDVQNATGGKKEDRVSGSENGMGLKTETTTRAATTATSALSAKAAQSDIRSALQGGASR
eukprot:3935780-Rhodomonas_salina.1